MLIKRIVSCKRSHYISYQSESNAPGLFSAKVNHTHCEIVTQTHTPTVQSLE